MPAWGLFLPCCCCLPWRGPPRRPRRCRPRPPGPEGRLGANVIRFSSSRSLRGNSIELLSCRYCGPFTFGPRVWGYRVAAGINELLFVRLSAWIIRARNCPTGTWGDLEDNSDVNRAPMPNASANLRGVPCGTIDEMSTHPRGLPCGLDVPWFGKGSNSDLPP